MRLTVTVLISAFCISISAHAQPVIRFVMPEFVSAPYLVPDAKGMQTGGLIIDLMQEIAANLNAKPEWLSLPRRRLELSMEHGDADLVCFMKRDWVAHPDAFYWSDGFIQNETLLVNRKGAPQLKEVTQLQGRHVGAVTGFMYPHVDAYFAQSSILRDDAASVESVLIKMLAGRTDYGLVDAFTYQYFLLHNHAANALEISFVVEDEATQCMLSKKSAWNPEQVFKVVRQVKSSKEAEQIFKRYR